MSNFSPWDHYEAAVRWARTIVRDDDAARDIALAAVQEVRVDDVVSAKHLSARLRGLVHYRAINHTKRSPRLDIAPGDPDDFATDTANPEDIVSARQLSHAFAMKLSLNEELAMGLFVDGYTYEEIATGLRTTPENVRQLLSRARAKWSFE